MVQVMFTVLQALEDQDADKRALAAALLWTSVVQNEPATLGYADTCSRLARRLTDADDRVRSCAVMAIWEHCFAKPTCDLSFAGDEPEVYDWLMECRTSNAQCTIACVELLGLLARHRGSTYRDFFKVLPRGASACLAFCRGSRRWRYDKSLAEPLSGKLEE